MPAPLPITFWHWAGFILLIDSIPAVFAVTQKPFIVFTSNIFAILGLRSLYFAVADAVQYFRFLKAGLAGVLIFVGVKMLASRWAAVPTGLSLAVVAAMIALSMGLSIGHSILARREERGT
jgi:tellurite resistance protein TerC